MKGRQSGPWLLVACEPVISALKRRYLSTPPTRSQRANLEIKYPSSLALICQIDESPNMNGLPKEHRPLYSLKHFGNNRWADGKVNPKVFMVYSFQNQKGIGQGHQGDILAPPLPRAAFKMIPPERSSMRRQTEKPGPSWFVSPLGPFDLQLFRRDLHHFALH